MPNASVAGKKYLYAVVAGSGDRKYNYCGIDGTLVHSISTGRVSAVVSDVNFPRIRPERRNLASHQKVISKLMEETTPLPVSFGVIASGAKAIRDILTLNQEALQKQLSRLDGKVEMGLRVIWDVPNIFEYFVDTASELRAFRDRLFGSGRALTQEEKLNLGRCFADILNEARDVHTRTVEKKLSQTCLEIRRNKCRTEREVMNLACLVGRDAHTQFGSVILGAAKLFDNNFAFDYIGPWAPYIFIEMDIRP